MSSSDRPASPTPSERERLDAEARKKEEAEQATLPYKWTQRIEDVDVTIPIPGNLKAKDLVVEIKKTRIKVQIKGQDPLIEVGLHESTQTGLIDYPHLPLHDDAYLYPLGRLSPSHHARRMHLDARDHSYRKRNLHPPRQTVQVRVVGTCCHHRTQDRRHEDPAGELEIERPRW